MVYQPFYSVPQLRYPYGQADFDFQMPNGAFTCTGPIYPSRFVTIDGSNAVRQSVSGDWPIAIAQDYTQSPFGPYAGTSGYQIQTFGNGFDCWLMLGGDVRAGRFLVPDDEGRGIEGLMNQSYAAQPYQNGSAGQLVRVKVVRLGPLMPDCYSDWSFEFSYEYGNGCSGQQP